MNFKDIEIAAFRSWPAVEESEESGVVLRYANGHTKRANSANLLTQQTGDFNRFAQRYESYFKEKGLPCIFRIPSFTDNQTLDSFLAERGYQYLDRSLVLCQPIDFSAGIFSQADDLAKKETENSNEFKGEVIEKNSDDWMRTYCEASDVDFNKQATHLEIVNRIEDETLFAVLKVAGVEVACAIGVISAGYFGVFDVVTKKSARKQGFATQLINSMLQWAQNKGAKHAYLQVVADNQAALKLYEKLGYKTVYEYGYRKLG